MIELKDGVNLYVENQDYHADLTYISSSGLKMVLKTPQAYYNRYILKIPEEIQNKDNLNFGTLAHLMILEPHFFDAAYVEWAGLRKSGKLFKEFKAHYPDKIILNTFELDKLKSLKEAYENHEGAVELITGCEFEFTICSEIDGIKVKARADAINVLGGFICDVKTTSYASDSDTFSDTIQKYEYDLSAALYCKIAEQIYGKPFDFYYIILSKSDLKCNIYKASPIEMSVGGIKVAQAINKLKYYLQNGFKLDNLIPEAVEIGTYDKEKFKCL